MYAKINLLEGNGYKIRQSSMLYVFDLSFVLDREQNTTVVY